MDKKVIGLILIIGVVSLGWGEEKVIKKVYEEENVKEIPISNELPIPEFKSSQPAFLMETQTSESIIEIKGEKEMPGFKESIVDKSQKSISSKETAGIKEIPISNELPIPGFGQR